MLKSNFLTNVRALVMICPNDNLSTVYDPRVCGPKTIICTGKFRSSSFVPFRIFSQPLFFKLIQEIFYTHVLALFPLFQEKSTWFVQKCSYFDRAEVFVCLPLDVLTCTYTTAYSQASLTLFIISNRIQSFETERYSN